MERTSGRIGRLWASQRGRWAMLGVAAVVAVAFAIASRPGPGSLAAVEADVTQRYGEVRQISGTALTEALSREPGVVIYDVREAAEYAVSHIAGAVRIDPDAAPRVVAMAIRETVGARKIVFYCAVGVRSSALAAEVQRALGPDRAPAIFNLTGGIFRWHNESRSLSDARGATAFVHPYDNSWGRLLERRQWARTTPQ